MGKYLNTVSNGIKIELIKTVRGRHHSGTGYTQKRLFYVESMEEMLNFKYALKGGIKINKNCKRLF